MTTIKTPVEMLDFWADAHGDKVYLRQPINGQYQDYTWQQTRQMAQQIAGGLRHLGFMPGDKIAVLSKNCAEWFITDFALMLGGYVSVPIYPTANADTISYSLEHSGAKAVFVGKLDYWQDQEPAVAGDIIRIAFPYDTMPAQYQWQDFLKMGEPLTNEPYPQLNDLMTIIYTSGSTGNPKGAMQTFASYGWTCGCAANHIQVTEKDRLISYLPLAHITERVAILGTSIYNGAQVAFVESLDTFIDDVNRCQPTFFLSVPRLWSLFQKNIIEKAGGAKKLNTLLRIPILNSLIKRKIRKGLGLNQCRLFGSGSAPLPKAIIQWFAGIGIEICEAWGMTENCAYSIINYPFNPQKIGTIGVPVDGCDVRLGDQNELLVRSPGLMTGYYKDDATTAQVFEADGFFHTGDVADIDADGYIKITGRIKDNFKTAKGKYVAPVPIERKLAQDTHIELLCVIGAGLPHPIALVQLAEGASLMPRNEVRHALKATLDNINPTLESHATLDAIVIVSEPWTTENDVLTPTLKIKRHILEQRFTSIVEGTRGAEVKWEDEL
ncbi:AMP-binding protein [Parashewanella tropica]|uniref:AMP-binding protein n=1 Tax=Parashewanella tropica TaxID=2547970 RepID=UPI00105A9266|nr:AMP-binding protein [Parashewanella tropica]